MIRLLLICLLCQAIGLDVGSMSINRDRVKSINRHTDSVPINSPSVPGNQFTFR